MAADRGLIQLQRQLSLQEARTNVPNLAPLYASATSMAKRGLDIVSGAIDEIKREEAVDEAGKKQQTDLLQKDANGVYKSIYELKETLPNKVVMAVKNEIKNLQEEFELVNTYGENDTSENNDARIRISAQLNRIKNEAVNLRTNLMLMTQDVKGDGGWDLANINKDNIDPLRSVLKGDLRDMDQNDNISVKFVDGKLTFFTENYSTGQIRGYVEKAGPEATYVKGYTDTGTTDEVIEEYKYGKLRSFNSDQMIEMLPRKTNEYLTASIGEYASLIKLGGSDAIQGTYNYDDQMAVNQANKFIGRVETKDEFQNAARANRKEGIPSLRESLMQRVDIHLAVMNTIFLDENGESIPVGEQLFAILNQNNDNVLDEKDYEAGLKGKNKEAFKIAYKQLLDVYTDIHNDAFNLDASLVLLGQHHEAYSKQHYDQGFEAEGGKIPGKYYPSKSGKNIGKDKGNYKLGQGGRMYNVATGEDTWVGYKYAGGTLQYDDEASLAAIKEHKEFSDYFQNIYRPVVDDISSFTNPGGKDTKGYNIVDGATGKLILGEDDKPIFVSMAEAIRNAYGKGSVSSASDFN